MSARPRLRPLLSRDKLVLIGTLIEALGRTEWDPPRTSLEYWIIKEKRDGR